MEKDLLIVIQVQATMRVIFRRNEIQRKFKNNQNAQKVEEVSCVKAEDGENQSEPKNTGRCRFGRTNRKNGKPGMNDNWKLVFGQVRITSVRL